MIEAIGRYGLKLSSYHELGVPSLKKEIENTKDMMKDHKESWKSIDAQ